MAVFKGWQKALLAKLGAPATAQNVRFVNAWAQAEGGSASFNPFNTTQGESGASDYNSVGVKNYRSPQQGIAATVETLLNGRYNPIVSGLRSGHATAAQLATDVAHSPWGTGSGVLRVLGAGPVKGGTPTRAVSQILQQVSGASPGGESPQQMLGSYLLQQAQDQLTGKGGNSVEAQGQGLLQMALARKAMQASQPQDLALSPGGKLVVKGADPSAPEDIGAVKLAEHFLGTPYVWGGSKPGGFDCSGLLQYVFGRRGINIPRTTYQQWAAGRSVNMKNLKPGDAVFFRGSDPGPNGEPGHVAMYIGNGKVIQAPHTGADVEITPLSAMGPAMGARSYG